MSLVANVKQKLMQCLIHKCDREYDRTYRYAQKQMSYANLIGQFEATVPSTQNGLELTYETFLYDWNQKLDTNKLRKITAKADVVLLCEQDIYLHEEALNWIGNAVATNPNACIWYGDEDVIDARGERSKPWLKPQWSPILFLSVHFLGGLVAVKSDFLQEFLEKKEIDAKNGEMSPRQFFYRLCKAAGGFCLGESGIAHTDSVLCHQPNEMAYEKFFCCENLVEVECESILEKKAPFISIVVPSKDHAQILMQNLKSLEKTIDLSTVEVVVVDNGSAHETRKEIENLIRNLTIKVEYVYRPMDFNFSAMCNLGAKASKGSLLLFLNDDIEAMEEGWLTKMAQIASIEYVGCVGAKLLYPNSNRIQHIGVMNLADGPVHKLQFLEDDENHYFGKNQQDGECLAVTGACLMVRKELFWEAGGFEEELPVTFNDIDLCYKMYAKGYYNVCLNSISLYHHESLSRGTDVSESKRKRLLEEREKLWQRHNSLKGRDPFYHKLLHREGTDTRIRPALEEHLPMLKQEGTFVMWREGAWKDFRGHEGVLCSIDQTIQNSLKGYVVMIGDDNACYENRVILKHKETGAQFWCTLKKVLREELQQNLPDQKNVALCGFDLKLIGLKSGEYEIIAVAHNKISRVSYWKETGKTVSFTEE